MPITVGHQAMRLKKQLKLQVRIPYQFKWTSLLFTLIVVYSKNELTLILPSHFRNTSAQKGLLHSEFRYKIPLYLLPMYRYGSFLSIDPKINTNCICIWLYNVSMFRKLGIILSLHKWGQTFEITHKNRSTLTLFRNNPRLNADSCRITLITGMCLILG